MKNYIISILALVVIAITLSLIFKIGIRVFDPGKETVIASFLCCTKPPLKMPPTQDYAPYRPLRTHQVVESLWIHKSINTRWASDLYIAFSVINKTPGLSGNGFSSHSLRRGLANFAIQNKTPLVDLVTWIKWNNFQSARPYLEDQQDLPNQLLKGLSDTTIQNKADSLPANHDI